MMRLIFALLSGVAVLSVSGQHTHTLECVGESACTGRTQTRECPEGEKCLLRCDGDFACKNARDLVTGEGELVAVECRGSSACKELNLWSANLRCTEEQACNMKCEGVQACMW